MKCYVQMAALQVCRIPWEFLGKKEKNKRKVEKKEERL